MLWGPATDSDPRRIVAGATPLALSLENNLYQNSGWRLTWLSGNQFDGHNYYNTIYRKGGGEEQVLLLDATLDTIESQDDQHRAIGHYVENVAVSNRAGTIFAMAPFGIKAGGSAPYCAGSWG